MINSTKIKKNFKNIIVISIDALRADHLGCYGYKKDITPNIDNLAKEGVLFKRAIAPGSYTFVSFPSFLTSFYPSEYYIKQMKVDTIADILKSHGYKTVSFNSNPYAIGKLDKGFDYFDDLMEHSEFEKPLEKIKRKIIKKTGKNSVLARQLGKLLIRFSAKIAKPYAEAERMNEAAIEWLEKNTEKPVFFWMHYMDPHYPYLPPARFTNLSKKEIIKLNRIRHISKHKKRSQKEILPERDIEKLVDLYDGEIKYVDTHIGHFINKLKKLDLYEDSLILLFSDHGELFGEYGEFAHKEYNVYHKQLHVPLIIKGIESQEKIIEHHVTLKDIPSTILDSLGLYSSTLTNGHLIKKRREFLISEGFKPQDVLSESGIDIDRINFTCHWNNWQFIFNSLENRMELYNLEKNLSENNLIKKEKEIASMLLNIIEKHKQRISKTQIIKNDIQTAISRIRI